MNAPNDLETLLTRAAADVHAPADLLERAGRRRRRHVRTRVAGSALALLVAVGGATVVVDTLRDDTTPDVVIEPTPSGNATTGDDAGPTDPEPTDAEPTDAEPTAGDEPGRDGVPGDGWSRVAAAPLDGRDMVGAATLDDGTVVVFAGNERTEDGGRRRDAATYDPAADSWSEVVELPAGGGVDAVDTDGVVVVAIVDDTPARGADTLLVRATDGGWSATAIPGPPLVERSVTLVDGPDGPAALVWGGRDPDQYLDVTNAGHLLDLGTSTWTTISEAPIPGRAEHHAFWNGRRFVVAGGAVGFLHDYEGGQSTPLTDAAVYDPMADTWATVPAVPALADTIASAWTGTELLAWNGRDQDTADATVAWNPATGAVRTAPGPDWGSTLSRRDTAPMAWDGTSAITWGGTIGEGGNHTWNDGAVLDPETLAWKVLPDAGQTGRTGHALAPLPGGGILAWGGWTDGYPAVPDSLMPPTDDGVTWRP